MKRPLVLIGGGGHCRSCIDVIESEGKFEIVGIVDNKLKKSEKVLTYKVIGNDEDLPRLAQEGNDFLITIGQIKSFEPRQRIGKLLKKLKAVVPTIVSPHAIVSKHSRIDEGSIIMHGAVVNAGARVGAHCIINSRALIEHDCVIGEFCHISTGAIVNGGCQVERGVFIGSQSVVNNHLTVKAGAVIGSGAVVNRPLKSKGVYAGNPARKLKIS